MRIHEPRADANESVASLSWVLHERNAEIAAFAVCQLDYRSSWSISAPRQSAALAYRQFSESDRFPIERAAWRYVLDFRDLEVSSRLFEPAFLIRVGLFNELALVNEYFVKKGSKIVILCFPISMSTRRS